MAAQLTAVPLLHLMNCSLQHHRPQLLLILYVRTSICKDNRTRPDLMPTPLHPAGWSLTNGAEFRPRQIEGDLSSLLSGLENCMLHPGWKLESGLPLTKSKPGDQTPIESERARHQSTNPSSGVCCHCENVYGFCMPTNKAEAKLKGHETKVWPTSGASFSPRGGHSYLR